MCSARRLSKIPYKGLCSGANDPFLLCSGNSFDLQKVINYKGRKDNCALREFSSDYALDPVSAIAEWDLICETRTQNLSTRRLDHLPCCNNDNGKGRRKVRNTQVSFGRSQYAPTFHFH